MNDEILLFTSQWKLPNEFTWQNQNIGFILVHNNHANAVDSEIVKNYLHFLMVYISSS